MHSNIHWVQKITVWFHLYEVPRIVKFIELESTLEMPGAREWKGGEEEWELLFNGDRASV